MTTFLTRIPKMILTVGALTFGTAGVAVATVGHTGAPAHSAAAQAAHAKGPAQKGKRANMNKQQRKQAKQQRKQAKFQGKQAKFQGKQAKQQRKQAKQMNKRGKHAKRLRTFDSNGNGKIEKAERVAVRQQRFLKIDRNGDGALTLGEMQVAKSTRQATKQAKRAQRIAALTPEKRAKHAKRMAKRNARRAQANKPGLAQRFAKLDANKNGNVSQGEFVRRPGKGKRNGKRKSQRRAKRQRS